MELRRASRSVRCVSFLWHGSQSTYGVTAQHEDCNLPAANAILLPHVQDHVDPALVHRYFPCISRILRDASCALSESRLFCLLILLSDCHSRTFKQTIIYRKCEPITILCRHHLQLYHLGHILLDNPACQSYVPFVLSLAFIYANAENRN
jgi:hypothetical protein